MSIGRTNAGGGGSKPSTTDAVLRVTAPSGSNVTIKKGSGASITPNFYLAGTGTDEYFFIVKASDFGTYNVTGTLSGKTATSSIDVNSAKEFSIELHYTIYIFNGSTPTEYTLESSKGNTYTTNIGNATEQSGWWDISVSGPSCSIALYNSVAIDVTPFSTLHFTGRKAQNNLNKCEIDVSAVKGNDFSGYIRATANIPYTAIYDTDVSVDISSVSGPMYIGVYLQTDKTIDQTLCGMSQLWLE